MKTAFLMRFIDQKIDKHENLNFASLIFSSAENRNSLKAEIVMQ